MAPLRFSHPLLLVAALLLSAAPGCGGSAENSKGGDGDGDGNRPGDGDGDLPGDGDGGDGDGFIHCHLGAETYDVGASVPSSDCNSCVCSADGTISCTTAGCGDGDGDGDGDAPAPCVVDGVTYPSGATVPGSDCGSCSCYDGEVGCDLILCVDQCSQPFEVGNCDAAFQVYWHNPDTGRCEQMIYGGCGGNENRFDTIEECVSTCDAQPPGASCEVDDIVYPDGANYVPDPASCNTCSCDDGEVTGCTEMDCPKECEDGTALGSDCAECGPVDNCVTVRTTCLPTCETEDDCSQAGAGACIDGLCKNFCG